MADLCYICFQDGDLVRPCNNGKCTARAHGSCLAKQYDIGNKKCGSCQNDMIITTHGEFDLVRCGEFYGKCLYLLFCSLVVHPLLVMTIFGNSLIDESIKFTDPPVNASSIVKFKTCSYLIITVIGIISWFIVAGCYIFGLIPLRQKCMESTQVYSTLYMLTIWSHIIGSYFLLEENFNIATFFYGLLLILLTSVLGGLLFAIAYGILLLYRHTMTEFYTKTYGVSVIK